MGITRKEENASTLLSTKFVLSGGPIRRFCLLIFLNTNAFPLSRNRTRVVERFL